MTASTVLSAPTRPSLHPETNVDGVVSLTVANLDRSLLFYTQAIGLAVITQTANEATLGVGDHALLHLAALPGARPWTEWATGLYHFAILLPTSADLGRWIRNWYDLGLPEFGQGDHLVSQALYLRDPDGHGIEIYRDRPRSEWHWDGGQIRMASLPVDVQGLLREAAESGVSWSGAPTGTTMGHVHLQVGDIRQARAFYSDLIGFDVVADLSTALFVSAGGYHHHLGMNIWHSRGNGPAEPGVASLQFFTINFPSESARQEVIERLHAAGYATETHGDATLVRDPWSTQIHLRVA